MGQPGARARTPRLLSGIADLELRMRKSLRAGAIAAAAVAVMAVVAVAAYAQSKDGRDRRVVIMNDRTSDMVRLYGSRTTTENWEENIIVAPIPSGARRVVNFDDGTGACLFDFRAIFRDNLTAHRWAINVCTEQYWRIVD
jgi:hypothetical protein